MSRLRQILGGVTGVWEGTYSHFEVDGTLIEKFESRQETRLVGEDWFERITYRRVNQDPEVIDFRARQVGEELLFNDSNFLGRTEVVNDRILAFPYTWKDKPHLKVLELIYIVSDNYRTRTWQSFENDKLVKFTLIEENRVIGGNVAIW
jgi:hypothetical protein